VIQQLTESTGASRPLYKSRLSRTGVCQPTSLLSRSSHPRRCQPTSLNASCLVLMVPADLTIRPVISAQFASQPLVLVPGSDLDALSKCLILCLLQFLPANLSIEAERSLPIWRALWLCATRSRLADCRFLCFSVVYAYFCQPTSQYFCQPTSL
jgi:hypothetical protein